MAKSNREREKIQRKKTDAAAWLQKQTTGEATGVSLPEGIAWWKPKIGVNKIDVVPFVTGKGNPSADEGYEHWERQYYRHYVPGFDGRSKPYACLGNWQEQCPICQYLQKLDNVRDKDVIQSMKGKLQMLMNIVDLEDRDKEKIQVWEAVYYNKKKGFGEQIITALRAQPKYLNFSDLQKGYTLILTVEEEQGGKGKYNVVTRIDFVERSHKYSDDFIEKTACLDDCLVKQSYGDLKRLVAGGPPEDEDDGEHGVQQTTNNGRSGNSSSPLAESSGRDGAKDDEDEETTESIIRVGNSLTHPKHDGKLVVLSVNPAKTQVKVKDENGGEHKLKASECSAYEEDEPEDDEWE